MTASFKQIFHLYNRCKTLSGNEMPTSLATFHVVFGPADSSHPSCKENAPGQRELRTRCTCLYNRQNKGVRGFESSHLTVFSYVVYSRRKGQLTRFHEFAILNLIPCRWMRKQLCIFLAGMLVWDFSIQVASTVVDSLTLQTVKSSMIPDSGHTLSDHHLRYHISLNAFPSGTLNWSRIIYWLYCGSFVHVCTITNATNSAQDNHPNNIKGARTHMNWLVKHENIKPKLLRLSDVQVMSRMNLYIRFQKKVAQSESWIQIDQKQTSHFIIRGL